MAKKNESRTKDKAAKADATQSETTDQEQTQPEKPWLFKPGQSGNPSGRPAGSRNKLSKRFIEDLSTVWHEANETTGMGTGIEALRAIAKDQPAKFVQVTADLVPKEFELGANTQRGFAELWRALATGKVPQLPVHEDDDDE